MVPLPDDAEPSECRVESFSVLGFDGEVQASIAPTGSSLDAKICASVRVQGSEGREGRSLNQCWTPIDVPVGRLCADPFDISNDVVGKPVVRRKAMVQ